MPNHDDPPWWTQVLKNLDELRQDLYPYAIPLTLERRALAWTWKRYR